MDGVEGQSNQQRNVDSTQVVGMKHYTSISKEFSHEEILTVLCSLGKIDPKVSELEIGRDQTTGKFVAKVTETREVKGEE